MMRVTKKLYALLIAGMMVVSLAGCQSTGNSSNSGNAQSEQSSKGSTNSSTKSVSSDNIPDFSGNMTVAVDNNNPDLTLKEDVRWRKRVLEKISCQKENAEQSVW